MRIYLKTAVYAFGIANAQAFVEGNKLTEFVASVTFQCHDKEGKAMNRKIRKAVFPVAGFGTRFLPATKAMPKELLPIFA